MRTILQHMLCISFILAASEGGAAAVGQEPDAFNPDTKTELMTPIGLGELHIDGEIGRRLDITVSNNLLSLDTENVFLARFPLNLDRVISAWQAIDATAAICGLFRNAQYSN